MLYFLYIKYKNLIDGLLALGKTFAPAMRKLDPSFHFIQPLYSFELLLQHSLIEEALADGVLHTSELNLIRKLQLYGDIVEFANHTPYKIKWADFTSLPAETVREWLNNMREVLRPVAEDFAVKFSVFTFLSESDCFCRLKDGFHSAAALLSLIDDDGKEIETTSRYQTILYDTIRTCHTLLQTPCA